MANNKGAAFVEWKAGTRLFPINSQGDFNRAMRHFKKAIKLDDRFARAYGWLAYTHITGHLDDWKFPKLEAGLSVAQRLKKAQQLADQAVKLAPNDYDTLWAKGFVRLHSGDARVAEIQFNKARALNYGNRELLAENADERVYAGHPDKAIELIMRARAIPDWQRWVLAWAYYFKARLDPVYYDHALDHIRAMHWQPGEPLYMYDVQLLKAIIHARLIEIEPDCKSEQETLRLIAKAYFQDGCAKYRPKISAWGRDDEDRWHKFARDEDRDHWLEGVDLGLA